MFSATLLLVARQTQGREGGYDDAVRGTKDGPMHMQLSYFSWPQRTKLSSNQTFSNSRERVQTSTNNKGHRQATETMKEVTGRKNLLKKMSEMAFARPKPAAQICTRKSPLEAEAGPRVGGLADTGHRNCAAELLIQ